MQFYRCTDIIGLQLYNYTVSNIIGFIDPIKNWTGHILRGESLLREAIEGRMIGKRPRGRKRLGMLNEFLKESSYAELKRKAENRKEWRIWKPRTCLTAEH